jgi:thiosulfate/3-mercaptopyruvate sulfurtransferase
VTALISVEELAAALAGDAPPVVLDVRWALTGPPGREEYAAGHIPGACFVDLETDLADPPGPRGRHPLPDPERFAAAMRRAGVRADRPVVVYDAASGSSAGRAWWLLRHHGHPDVRLLDGGIRAWRAADQPISTEPCRAPEGDFAAGPGRLAVVDAAQVATYADSGTLLDARAPARYRGDEEPVDPVAGHIPGAVNLPLAETVDDTGRLLPVTELTLRFTAAGGQADAPVAAYCGSGVNAAMLVLALDEAGIPAALYPGSWSEWVADPDRPVATGDS